MSGGLVAFHEGASAGVTEERRVEGRRAEMPYRGVCFGCSTGNEGRPKPLQTRRARLDNAVLASLQSGGVSGSLAVPRPEIQLITGALGMHV